MALEDCIRPSLDTALDELTSHVTKDVRALVEQIMTSAAEDREEALKAARQREMALASAREADVAAAVADTARQVAEAETRGRAREREAGLVGLKRALEGIRALDGAATLTDVLDVLARSASRETSRAAVLVVRQERLLGWKLTGFGAHDSQPRNISLDLGENSVASTAVRTARPVTTRDGSAAALQFAQLSADRVGMAVPLIVGGRAVAVVYADDEATGQEHEVSGCWAEVVELLVRHASRCLEALTVQKTTGTAAPRFWTQGASQPGASA
jgi:hypothetical protein